MELIIMNRSAIVNSISRGVDILKCLAQGVNRLEDIYTTVGLSKSTTHRILKSLVEVGMAVQDPSTRLYHLGYQLLKLAANPLISHHVLTIAAFDELIRLRDLSGESALIIIPNGVQRLVVKEVSSTQEIAFSWKDGNAIPIHIGSSGKLLLAEFDERERETLLRCIDLQPMGPNSITDPDRLRDEIKKIRTQGYAISYSEAKHGTAGISVPVKNYVCPVALCLFGPGFRFSPDQYLDEMKKSAVLISEMLIRNSS